MGGLGDLFGGLLGGGDQGSAQAASYAAEKQYEIARRVEAREDELFRLWRTVYKPIELELADEYDALEPYTPQTTTAQVRVLTDVRKTFAKARLDARACMDVHCVGAHLALVREMGMTEARSAAWAMSLAGRAEEQKARDLDLQYRKEKQNLAQLGHGAYFSDDAARLGVQISDHLAKVAADARDAASAGAGFVAEKLTTQLQRQFAPTGSLGKRGTPAPIAQSKPTTVVNVTNYNAINKGDESGSLDVLPEAGSLDSSTEGYPGI